MPLLIKEPGQADGGVDEAPVRTIDVLPTIAEVLQADLPDGLTTASQPPSALVSMGRSRYCAMTSPKRVSSSSETC